ncbi:MAG: dephospho-CoA kinase [Candidatus Fonsibacter sp.]|nr:dephospho-CoA kinase [Candidatus Fonsibacter sp.]
MVRVGILGSVGSGKTFIANIFKELSFNIFSADNEVANIYKNNKIVNKKIAKFFKLKLYKGKINKQDLRDSLKKNPKKFKFLNKTIHPIVRKRLAIFLSRFKKNKLVVLDIPLLVENKMLNFVDILVLVKTRSNSFLSRIKKRKNLNKQFLNILKKQQVCEKIKEGYADFIIYNSSKNKVKLQVKNIIDKILLN